MKIPSKTLCEVLRISNLSGKELDLEVAKCEGFTEYNPTTGKMLPPRKEYGLVELSAYNYSTDWAQAGPIIERERIDINFFAKPLAELNHDCYATKTPCHANGPTPLVAAMRCYLISKLGDEVEDW
jgi:hypothetical protein